MFLPHRTVVLMALLLSPLTAGAADYRLTIFLNFDGARLTAGSSDAPTDKSDLLTAPSLDYPAMNWTKLGGRDKGITAVIDELKLLFMKMAVEFVTTRPASGEYTMAAIGGWGEGTKGAGSAVGISPLDCKNLNKNDVVLVFAEKLGGSAKSLAFVISHELGHSFGLEHTEDPKSIMAPALTNQTTGWTSATVEAPSACKRTTQDDERVLLENLGAGPGDSTAPLVWFMRPGPGAVLPANFSIEAGAADDLRIHHVNLFFDGQKKLEAPAGPYAAFFTNQRDGEHVLRAEAVDWKPNSVSTEITITVDALCPQKGTCTEGSGTFNASCQHSTECDSGLCAVSDGGGRCTMSCEGEGKLCPNGTSCQSSGESWICAAGPGWSIEKPGEEGCSLGGPRPASLTSLFLPIVLAGLFGLRRRRA